MRHQKEIKGLHQTKTKEERKKEMKTILKHTFKFGKVAYTGNRKTCPAEVTLELREEDKGLELSICGAIWNHLHTDIYSGGQNLDEMKKYLAHNKTFMRLYRLWENWHLNGMHSGTAKQEAAVNEWRKHVGGSYDYTAACEYLKGIGLYVDSLADNERLATETFKANRKHYEYGHGWIHRDIPTEVEAEIFSLCGKD